MSYLTIDVRGLGIARAVSEAFPETRAEELAAIDSDTESLARYVAFVHDLTVAEAREMIEVWILPAFARAVRTARAA